MLKDRIRELRKARGWTQAHLAARAGMTQGAVTNLETGARDNPTQETLDKLARAFGMTVAELIEDDDLAGPFPAANWQGHLDARLLRRYGRLWATADRRDRAWIKGQLDLFVQAEAHVRSLEAKAQAQAGGAAEPDTDPPFADDEPDPVVQYVGA